MTRATLTAAVLAILLALYAVMGRADRGAAQVIDGDTLIISGTHYRLQGIDAPEIRQTCAGWQAGPEAAAYMRALIRDREVTCEPHGHDRYGRTLARCFADGIDLQAEMVAHGMAWAYRQYSPDYIDQENAARADMLGVHAHPCDYPWNWRHRRTPTPLPPK